MKNKRSYVNIADLIRMKRRMAGLSQSGLALKLGYAKGQYISNIERGLCAFPYDMIKDCAKALGIEPQEIKDAILKDHEDTMDSFIVDSPIEENQEVKENPITFAGGII